MSAVKITEGIYSVGIMNPNMRVFDIVMKTDSGTSYNSYLVRGSEKTALIETCHESFFEEYLENIKEVCKFEEIDYIVMNHNEPDHSGSLAKLLELMPNAQLIASIAGANYLKNITNRCDLDIHKVKDGETLDLGGLSLTFLSAPNLHCRIRCSLGSKRQTPCSPVTFWAATTASHTPLIPALLIQRLMIPLWSCTTAPSSVHLHPLYARVWKKSKLCRSSRTISAPATVRF